MEIENLSSLSGETIKKTRINFDELNSECMKNGFIKGNIYIFTNIGLVASGKSTVFNYLEKEIFDRFGEELVNYRSVSSDAIRAEIELKMKKEKSKMSEEKFNKKLSTKTKKEFDDQLFEIIENYHLNKYNFILLDKNFFVNTLQDLKMKLDADYPEYKKFIEVICFFPKCYSNLLPYELSLNYIIQSFYRLKNRKNHETLDFTNNPNAHLIFFSFLSLFMKMIFRRNPDLNIYFYSLSMSDERELDIDKNFDFILNFNDIMKRVKANSFKMDKLMEINEEIQILISDMENIFPQNIFNDTRDKVLSEIKELVKNKSIKDDEI